MNKVFILVGKGSNILRGSINRIRKKFNREVEYSWINVSIIKLKFFRSSVERARLIRFCNNIIGRKNIKYISIYVLGN